MKNDADYKTEQEALNAIKNSNLKIGDLVKENDTNKERKIVDIQIVPYTWYNNGIEEIKGYNSKIVFSGTDGIIRLVDFDKHYTTL